MSFLSFVRIPLVVFRHLCRSQSNIFLIYVLETTGNCVEFTPLRIVVKNKLFQFDLQSLLLVRLLQFLTQWIKQLGSFVFIPVELCHLCLRMLR